MNKSIKCGYLKIEKISPQRITLIVVNYYRELYWPSNTQRIETVMRGVSVNPDCISKSFFFVFPEVFSVGIVALPSLVAELTGIRRGLRVLHHLY